MQPPAVRASAFQGKGEVDASADASVNNGASPLLYNSTLQY